MSRFPGGIIRKTPIIPSPSSASGVWTLAEVLRAAGQGIWPVPDIDQYVKLMLHMDGPNGSSTFVDSSSLGLSPTLSGSPTISTSQSKFGGASGLFGSGNRLNYSSSEHNVGTGDFSVECWVYPLGDGSTALDVIGQGTNGFNVWLSNAPHKLKFSQVGVIDILAGSATIANNTWTHIAVARAGTSLKSFVNGAVDSSATSSANLNSSTTSVGARPGSASGDHFNGYLDEVRLSKGIARWTGAFTPSARPYW